MFRLAIPLRLYLSEQDTCEGQANEWTKLWSKGVEYSVLESEWNNRSMAPSPLEGYCPLNIHHIRAAIKTLPMGTARVANNCAVWEFNALSDDALAGLR